MSINRAKQLLKQNENIRLEFKEARTQLPENLFETICAMLNRDGGDIFLGVADHGALVGVDLSAMATVEANLVNLSNNPQKLDPPFILFPLKYQIEDKWILHVQVPASSQVHRTAGQVYDRSHDGDFKVTQPHRIAEIYNRKRNHYTEGLIYPALRFEDFKQDLFPKVRNLIRSNEPSHPWLGLTDEQLLQKAGLWKRDFQSGQEGYTLAAALLFGKDDVIQQILPHYKTDALVRIHDSLRYDDREYIQTNLIEAYEKLMDFVAKHLPDKFYMEANQRVSLRAKIFREVVANLLVHREFTSAHPSTFIIYKGRVETENANNPHGSGPIDLHHFTPFPKNPALAKFFIQLGRVEELGSGILNVNRFIKEYAGLGSPDFIEGDTFKMIIPVPGEGLSEGLNEGLSEGISEGINNAIRDAVSLLVGSQIKKATKERLAGIVQMIRLNPGQKIKDLNTRLPVSDRAFRDNISLLVKHHIITYAGSKKTGGYFLHKDFQSTLNADHE